ncbi:hypothetical protein I8748_05530 [Nostoc sp. CENA67]|uniref:Uncharacterized protein n=1 Tax=Amazonocrinis nigriterrae CENA67 TaxID=2794033 RepID=A0A8J7HSM4_9NOST|nr:hypothetical protein [Amazonocrinis nigriterrae]MBH8561644.1 hypothetical protein [Amazonocrinis nigriterrae CENA67]
MVPPTTISGQAALKELTALSRELKYYADGFKAAKQLKSKYAEIDQIKKGVKTATQSTKDLEKQFNPVKKKVEDAKKTLDNLFKKVPGKDNAEKAAKSGGSLAALLAVGGVAAITAIIAVLQDKINSFNIESSEKLNIELSKTQTLAVNASLKAEAIKKILPGIQEAVKTNELRINGVERQLVPIRKNANEALYEIRAGRKILEEKIAEARKIGNDALYETRAGRAKLETQIATIQAKVNQTLSSIGQGFQQQINSTIANIQRGLLQSQAEVKAASAEINNQRNAIGTLQANNKLLEAKLSNIKTPDINTIANSIKSSTAQEVNGLRAQINGLLAQLTGIQNVIPTLIGGVSNVGKVASTANAKADAAINEARNKGVPDLSPLQKNLDNQFNKLVEDNKKSLGVQDLKISDLGKKFNQDLQNFQRQSNLDASQRFAEFTKQNNEALGVRDLKISDLGKDFDKKLADFKDLSTKSADERFQRFQEQNRRDLDKISNSLNQTNTKIKEQEKVNEEANKKLGGIDAKLDSIIPTIAGIPLVVGKAADNVIRNIPTPGDIERATTTGVCRSTQPGGCMNRALNDQSNNINNNTNNAANNILQGLDTAGTGALLTGQQEILNRLGDQLPGGIGGKLSRLANWLHLDRALNILIWWQTLHNAYMLSSNLGQTLFSTISNLLAVIGIKDAEGSPLDIGEIFGGQVDAFGKTIFGVQEWNGIKAEWKKWNRIYQAAANLLNSLQSIGYSILSALEVVGSWVAVIGNALRKWGEVGESAYRWMNPTPNFQNKFFTTLENVENVVSQVDQVASEVLSVQETVTQIGQQKDEFFKALGQEPNSKQGTTPPEAAQVKAGFDASKLVSATGLAISDEDKEADE